MRLAKLTGLEIDKLEAELKEVRAIIKELRDAPRAPASKRMALLKSELQEIAAEVRRRAPHRDHERRGRVHRRGPDRRRGHGHHHLPLRLHQAHPGVAPTRSSGAAAAASTVRRSRTRTSSSTSSSPARTTTCCSSPTTGACFWLKVHEIPQAGRAARGKPVVNCINVTPTRRSRRWCRCASSATTSTSSSPPRTAR